MATSSAKLIINKTQRANYGQNNIALWAALVKTSRVLTIPSGFTLPSASWPIPGSKVGDEFLTG